MCIMLRRLGVKNKAYCGLLLLCIFLASKLIRNKLNRSHHLEKQLLASSEVDLHLDKTCPQNLVVLIEVGRMGNMFFEHLACRLMAKVWRRNYFVRPSFFDFFNRYFKGWETLSLDELKTGCRKNKKDFVVYYLDELPNPKGELKPFIQCKGYPDQMPLELWKEIYSERKWLLREFLWRPKVMDSLSVKLGPLKAVRTYSVTVGVHVRRGDYELHLNKMYGTSHLAGANFFKKSMKYFREKYINPLFIIISNDIRWSKRNIVGDDIIYPAFDQGFDNENDPGLALATLSSSDHLILTYGTFGLMAAFFNEGGEVIAAANFTSKPYPQAEILKALKLPNWKFMSIE